MLFAQKYYQESMNDFGYYRNESVKVVLTYMWNVLNYSPLNLFYYGGLTPKISQILSFDPPPPPPPCFQNLG